MPSKGQLYLKPIDPIIALHPDTLDIYKHQWFLSDTEKQVLDQFYPLRSTFGEILENSRGVGGDLHCLSSRSRVFQIVYLTHPQDLRICYSLMRVLISFRYSRLFKINFALVRFNPPDSVWNLTEKVL